MRKPISIAVVLILIVLISACDIQEEKHPQENLPGNSFEMVNNAMAPYTIKRLTHKVPSDVNEPLRHALSLIGLNRQNMVRPLAREEGYLLGCRIPLIDHAARSPFYLHYWADETSSRLQQAAAEGLSAIFAQALMTLNGGVAYPVPMPVPEGFQGDMAGGYRLLYASRGQKAPESSLAMIEAAGFTSLFSRQVGRLLVYLSEAGQLLQEAFALLTDIEKDFLRGGPERYFFPDGERFSFLTAPTHTQTRIVALSRKIDFVRLYTAAGLILRGVDQFYAYIKGLDTPGDERHYFRQPSQKQGMVLRLPSPIGDIAILGMGSQVYAKTDALLIDLGGNDRYHAAMGVGHLTPGGISVAIDIGGDDIYDHKTQSFSQGVGCLSIGLLFDISGNDRYISGDMSQGTGMYGVGLVADLEGNDRYRMGLMGQGFGLFGIGLLVDSNGADHYLIGGMGQGAASTMGMGSLCDLAGDDKYLSDRRRRQGRLKPDQWSHVQGAGLSIRSPDWTKAFSYYGGIGILSEGNGDDYYYASDANCMGASYFMSIGALVDQHGDDKYTPQQRNGLGWAVHLSNAILIDRQGDDYYAGHHSGGMGSDRSIGFLADYAGDDIYGPTDTYIKQQLFKSNSNSKNRMTEAERLALVQQRMADFSYGVSLKPKGLGFLIDYQGNDRYFAKRKGTGEGCGGVIPPETPEKWSHALLLDLSGKDFYHLSGRKNNHYHLYAQHGLCYDIDYHSTLKPGKTPLPHFRRQLEPKTLSGIGDAKLRQDILQLFHPDLFVRYAAVGRLISQGPQIIAPLIGFLAISASTEVNRDIAEIIDTFIARREIPFERNFEILLQAVDPWVRHYGARALGWGQVRSALPGLINALQEQNDTVRADLIWALGKIDPQEASKVLIETFKNDSALTVRRNAMMAIASDRFSKKDVKSIISDVLLKGLIDPDETIRTHAAAGLANFGPDPVIVQKLKSVLVRENESVYVRRALARALIRMGVKEAIPVLMQTLQYRSIDTFEFYDHDLAKELAFYCGIDFPAENRYRYETWRQWWRDKGDQVNLAQNLAIMDAIKEAFSAKHEEAGIIIFKRLMQDYPQNVVIRKRYQRFCYEWINYRLLTREQISAMILERCIRLQNIILALEPESTSAQRHLQYFQGWLASLQGVFPEAKGK